MSPVIFRRDPKRFVRLCTSATSTEATLTKRNVNTFKQSDPNVTLKKSQQQT